MRAPISAEERLTLTLHYLAYGSSQQEVSFSYRIAKLLLLLLLLKYIY